MTDEKTRALIAEARTDISDAERCEMLGVTPSVGTLLRMLRNVTNALSALTVPDGDALEKLKAEALKSWQAGVEIRRYSEFFTSFEDGFDRGYAAALSRASAGVAPQEPSTHAKPVDTSAERVKNQDDSLHVAPVLSSSGVDEAATAEVERAAAVRALEDAANDLRVSFSRGAAIAMHHQCHKKQCRCGNPGNDEIVREVFEAAREALRARAAEIRGDHGHD